MYEDDSKNCTKPSGRAPGGLADQEICDRISTCAKDWQLQLNLEKTKKLTIAIDRFSFEYSLYGAVFEQVESIVT